MVCRKFRHATQHGAIEGKIQTQEVTLYNLDIIISVGYRVKSIVGTRFCQWKTERMSECNVFIHNSQINEHNSFVTISRWDLLFKPLIYL